MLLRFDTPFTRPAPIPGAKAGAAAGAMRWEGAQGSPWLGGRHPAAQHDSHEGELSVLKPRAAILRKAPAAAPGAPVPKSSATAYRTVPSAQWRATHLDDGGSRRMISDCDARGVAVNRIDDNAPAGATSACGARRCPAPLEMQEIVANPTRPFDSSISLTLLCKLHFMNSAGGAEKPAKAAR